MDTRNFKTYQTTTNQHPGVRQQKTHRRKSANSHWQSHEPCDTENKGACGLLPPTLACLRPVYRESIGS